MDPERWKRVDALFHRVADLAPAERAARLDEACVGDPALRAEIDRLLAVDADVVGDPSRDLFHKLETRAGALPGPDPFLGRTLGAYRLIERLGAGGMGVVYRAERADGLYQQDVAIKLVRGEHATDWMLRRFEFERRALASLEHPCIARLYDGGTTDDGCPYFVMELIRGETIDRYCERERLSIEARLRLFVQVCRAVHYAHQSLVVHCDLKPANILIDGQGVPRLLDFGIARFLEEDASATTGPGATRTIARVLTPEYASPEQLAGGPVTTSQDVYSLGVVLYELLAGCRPFESDSRSLTEWERLVREQTPPRPSVRRIGASLSGDLDRIVLMALRKEPERRYASAQEFADDIERHLAGQPVRARPNSLGYLAAKFVGRNRVAVGAAVIVLFALLGGLIAARRSGRIAEAEAEHARMEADSFQSIASFLMDGFLPDQPSQDAEWQSRAKGRVLAQAEQVRRQYADNVHVRANLLDTLGQVLRRLDLGDDAKQLMAEAKSIRADAFGTNSLEYAISLRSLGQLAYDAGEFAEGAALLEEAMVIHRASGTSTHADVASIANDLGACLRNLGRDADAERLHREALALRRATGDGTLPVAESLNNLSGVHFSRKDYATAIPELQEALAIRERILGAGHLLTAQTMSNLALARWRHDDRTEALELMRRCEAAYRALGGDGEEGLSLVLANHASMQMTVKDHEGAATSLEEALELQRRHLRPDHPLIATSMVKLATLHHLRGRDELAREAWIEAVRIRRDAAIAPRDLAEATAGYGHFLTDIEAWAEAKPLLNEASALHQANDLKDPASRGRIEYDLGRCADAAGDRTAAREHYVESLRLLESTPHVSEEDLAKVKARLDALTKK